MKKGKCKEWKVYIKENNDKVVYKAVMDLADEYVEIISEKDNEIKRRCKEINYYRQTIKTLRKQLK